MLNLSVEEYIELGQKLLIKKKWEEEKNNEKIPEVRTTITIVVNESQSHSIYVEQRLDAKDQNEARLMAHEEHDCIWRIISIFYAPLGSTKIIEKSHPF